MASGLLSEGRMHSGLTGDIRYALRSLARTPVWTATLMLTIALGIGSGAAVQGFVRGLLTTDLPIFAIERVVTVFAIDAAGASGPVPHQVFATLKARSDVFESLAAIRESQKRVSLNSQTTLMAVAAYSPDALTVFPFPSRAGVTLASHVRFANFPASIDPSGRTAHIDASPVTIAGTMPYWLEGLYRGREIDLWVPLDEVDGSTDGGPVWLIGRLRAGVPVEAAQAAIDQSVAATNESITVLP
jgi:putative ABC transport system permease protein